MHIIIGSPKRGCVLNILFQCYDSKAGLFKFDLFWMMGQSYDRPTFILEEKPIQYQYNLIQFLSNLCKIIPFQKTADIIL